MNILPYLPHLFNTHSFHLLILNENLTCLVSLTSPEEAASLLPLIFKVRRTTYYSLEFPLFPQTMLLHPSWAYHPILLATLSIQLFTDLWHSLLLLSGLTPTS